MGGGVEEDRARDGGARVTPGAATGGGGGGESHGEGKGPGHGRGVPVAYPIPFSEVSCFLPHFVHHAIIRKKNDFIGISDFLSPLFVPRTGQKANKSALLKGP